jgi:hypothetical protein
MVFFAICGALGLFVVLDYVLQVSFHRREDYKFSDFLFWLALYAVGMLAAEVLKLGDLRTIVMASGITAIRVGLLLYRSDRLNIARYLLSLASMAACIAAVIVMQPDSRDALRNMGLHEIVWSRADQLVYVKQARDMLAGDLSRYQYSPGYAFSLIPNLLLFLPNLGAKYGQNLFTFSNNMNLSLLALYLGVLLPASLMLLSRAVCECLGPRSKTGLLCSLLAPSFLALCFFLYAIYVPEWMSPRNYILGIRRLLGLSYAPETLSLLLTSFLLAAAARPNVLSTKKSVIYGLISGLLLIVSERNIVFVAAFGCILLLAAREFPLRYVARCMVAFAASAAAFMSAYPLYTKLIYGGFFVSARSQIWEIAGRQAYWAKRMPQLYPSVEITAPSRVSALYMPENMLRLLDGYWLALPIFAASIIWLIVSKSPDPATRAARLNVGIIAGMVGVLTIFMVTSYVNPHVGFRYYGSLVPVFGCTVLLLAVDVLMKASSVLKGSSAAPVETARIRG